MSDLTITLCDLESGASESMPVSPQMSIADCLEFARALLGIEGDFILVKDRKKLVGNSLFEAGVRTGDLLVVMKSQSQPTSATPTVGALDFSNLLASSTSTGENLSSTTSTPNPALNFSNLLSSASASRVDNNANDTVYYSGMTLDDAMEHNPHPGAIVKLLQTHEHLRKELNYHNPNLAQKLRNQPFEKAVEIWRASIVKGSIQSANAITQAFHKEHAFQKRLLENPDDKEAKAYFESKRKRALVSQQYHQAMQEYPESMGKVLMLYIETKINNHSLQAFVDSGAQMTIMSKKCAERCGVIDYLDTRFAGVAVGVGTGKILGRIHIVQLQIGDTFFPCSVTVMDDATLPTSGSALLSEAPKPKEMDFLLGLDMLKRHQCSLDLGGGCLKFKLEPGKYMEAPFLHEKDLDESKGGTKGFNADRANEQLEKARKQYEEKNLDTKMDD